MLSLENASPLIYSNVGLFGAFVCSPLAFATALAVEGLSLAITGASVFTQKKQQLAKIDPAPAHELRTTPAPTPIVSVEPVTVVAPARGIDAATGSNSPNSHSSASACDLILIDEDQQKKDMDELSERFAKFGSDEEDGASESGSDGSGSFADGEVVVLQLHQLERVVGDCTMCRSGSPLHHRGYCPYRRQTGLASRVLGQLQGFLLNTVSVSSSATLAKQVAKPKVAPISSKVTPKPISAAKVTIPAVVAPSLKPGSPLRTSSPATPRPSSPLTSPPPSQKSKTTSPSRISLLANRTVVPSPTQLSTSRDTPLPSSATTRPATPSSAKSSPLSQPNAKVSPTPIFPSSVAPAPKPELTPPPTPPPRRKPASSVRSTPKTSSLLPALPIPSPVAASDMPKLQGLESSRWAFKGYKEKINAGVRADKEKHARAHAAEDAAYIAARDLYHDTLMSSPLGAVVTPPKPPAYLGDKAAFDNFIEEEGSGSSSNPPAVAIQSAKVVEDSSDDDSDEESVEDNTPRIIRPLRRGRLVAVPGSQPNLLATPVAISPFAPALAVFPSQQTGYSPISFDFGSTPVAETTMVDDLFTNYSSGVDQYSPEAFMDAQPEPSIPDRSYLDSSYDYSSYSPSPSFSSFSIGVDSPFDDYPATPLANLYSTAGFASFASSSPPSFSQPSSSTPSFYPITPPVHSSLFANPPPRDYGDIDAILGKDAEIFDKVAPYYTSTTSALPPPPPIPTPTPIAPSASSAPRAYNEPLPFPSTPPATAGPSAPPRSKNMALLDQLEAEEEEEKKKSAKRGSRMAELRRRASGQDGR
ncbi:hypothetical protein RQP46_001928 [Phenoliferia psychrophenolica]